MVDTTGDSGSALGDRAELAHLMRTFGEGMRRRFLRVVGEHDLTAPLFAALQALDEPCPMRDVASRLSCDASYVTGLADRLETLGLAERQSHPDDRRVKQLALTDRGREVRAAVLDKMESSHDLFPQLDDHEVQTMVRVYRKLAQQ